MLEGQAPDLKAQVMKKRQEARYGPSQAAPESTTNTNVTKRSRYQFVQKECVELLNALGVATVTSLGEAEAACAGLNYQGAVDGCITIDGDAFLYGAEIVYRNLSTDINNFVCQEYSMNTIESQLNLSRDKLVVMAILFGCDYLPDGIPGVQKESALRVLSTWENGKAMKILNSWISEDFYDDTIPPRPAHCSQCKHPGSLRGHAKSGCNHCETLSLGCKPSTEVCPCDWHKNEIHYEEIALRTKVRRMRELVDVNKIFLEFENDLHKQRKGSPIPSWKMPSIQAFIQISTKKLKWEPSYAAEKILPLLSRWIVIHNSCPGIENENFPIVPSRILKKRVRRGCPMYEIEWQFKNEIENFPALFNTLEPQFLVEKAYGNLLLSSVPKPVEKKKVRRKAKSNEKKKPTVNKELDVITMFKKMTIEANRAPKIDVLATNPSEESSLLDLTGGTDDSDLSAIIDVICSRKKKLPRIRVSNLERVQNSPLNPSEISSETVELHSGPKSMINSNGSTEQCLPNFSLNFSLGKLMEMSNCVEENVNRSGDNFQNNCSTPCKLSSSHNSTRLDKSFSTPSPLAERFSRFHI